MTAAYQTSAFNPALYKTVPPECCGNRHCRTRNGAIVAINPVDGENSARGP